MNKIGGEYRIFTFIKALITFNAFKNTYINREVNYNKNYKGYCWNSQVAGNTRCIGCRANRLCEWKIFICEPHRVGGSNSNRYWDKKTTRFNTLLLW